MARLLADEDIYSDLKELLRSHGHDVTSVVELGSRGDGDHLWMINAAGDERVILTHNWRDFLLLHNAWKEWVSHWALAPPPQHSGILCVPQKDLLSVDQTTKLIADLLSSERSFHNRYLRLFPSRGWVEYR